MKRKQDTHITRKLNPKLGYLGFLGFLGFAGFFTYAIDQAVFPFCFFTFFGFFGFFFEGKMSNTYMDERFKENDLRAQLKAYRIGFSITFLLLISIAISPLQDSPAEYALIFLLIGLSLTIALVQILSQYLLYKYDHEEPADESEDM